MRNSPSDIPNGNINPILEQITTKWFIDAQDASVLLRQYDANKNKILTYSQKNLDLFRKMLSIETKDRYFGTPDIMLLRSIVKSQMEGILDGTDSQVVAAQSNPARWLNNASTSPWNRTEWLSQLALEWKWEWASVRLWVDDLRSVAKMVKAEAGGEPPEWQQAVLNVIFNRVLDGRFGRWVKWVLFRPGEFSPVSDGRFARSSLDKDTIALVTDFLKAWSNPLDEALFFQANYITKWWMNRTQRKIATIWNHSFFWPKEDVVASRKKSKDDTLAA